MMLIIETVIKTIKLATIEIIIVTMKKKIKIMLITIKIIKNNNTKYNIYYVFMKTSLSASAS